MDVCDSLVPLKVFPPPFRAKTRANKAVWMKSESGGIGLALLILLMVMLPSDENRDQILTSPPPFLNIYNLNDRIFPFFPYLDLNLRLT